MADPPGQPPRPISPDEVTINTAPLPTRQTQLGNVIIDPDRWYGPPESAYVEQRSGRSSPPVVNHNRTLPLLPSTRPPGQSSRHDHPGFSLTPLDPDVNPSRSSTSSISPIFPTRPTPLRPTPLRPNPLGEASTHTGQSAVSGTTLHASLQSPGSGGTQVPPPNITSGTSSTPAPSFPSSRTARQSSTSSNPPNQGNAPNQANPPKFSGTKAELMRYFIAEGREIPQEVLDMPDRVRRRDWFSKKCRDFKEWCKRLARKG
jgi:hypothetical protein